jgi:N-acetylneuraminic acid mutarotase
MYPAHNLGSMTKLKYLIFATILALAFGLMLSCSKSESDDTPSSASAVTVSGIVQKGPYVQGTEITVRELDSSMTPTGNTFTGTIDDNAGSFSIKGTLANKIAELAADGYYFNEVSGALSTSKLSLQAFSDLTDSSSVNVNLMTHLEKKRVEYLMDNSKMTFAAAKTQAQTEIMKIFNIENVTLGNSETLDISKSGDGNAVLLAISAILQSDKTEAELTELLSTINTDIRTDGTLDSTTTKATLVTAMEYLKSRRSTIRSNIESRYSDLGISATIPAFESYAFKLDTTTPTVASTSPADNSSSIQISSTISVTFSEVIDTSTITINTTNTTCSGTIQVSSDNFSTCVQISSSPTASNSDKIFTVTPSSSLSYSTTYKIRVTTGVKDIAGNNIITQSTTSTGFNTTGWSPISTMTTGRVRSVAEMVNNKIYVIGGETCPCDSSNGSNGSSIKTVEEYDIASDSWSSKSDMLTSRSMHASVIYNNKIYVMGGVTISGSSTLLSSTEVYDPSSNGWDNLSSFSNARYHFATAVVGTKIYIIGGIDSGGNRIANVDSYEIGTDSWSTSPTDLSVGRTNHTAQVYNSKIYIFGGRPSGHTGHNWPKTVLEFDPSSGTNGTWTDKGEIMPLTSTYAGDMQINTIAVSNKIYIVHYRGQGMYEWDIASDSWTTKDRLNPCSGTGNTSGLNGYFPLAADTSYIYAFGGQVGQNYTVGGCSKKFKL